jgi:hypothetical protein
MRQATSVRNIRHHFYDLMCVRRNFYRFCDKFRYFELFVIIEVFCGLEIRKIYLKEKNSESFKSKDFFSTNFFFGKKSSKNYFFHHNENPSKSISMSSHSIPQSSIKRLNFNLKASLCTRKVILGDFLPSCSQ